MKVIEKVRETTRKLQAIARRKKQQPPKVMQARVRAAMPATADDYDDDEPQTKLTSAFVVVLILHVIAVGGIYAFNQIKASRRPLDPSPTATAPTPPKTAVPARETKVEEPATTAASITKPRSYTVKPGDTLGSIAKTYGVTISDLKMHNGLTTDAIRPGQALAFAASAKPVETAAKPATEGKPATKNYTVKAGDRLIFIAKKFNVTQEDLIALNKIKDTAKLQIGQTLKVPVKK